MAVRNILLFDVETLPSVPLVDFSYGQESVVLEGSTLELSSSMATTSASKVYAPEINAPLLVIELTEGTGVSVKGSQQAEIVVDSSLIELTLIELSGGPC